MRGGQTSSESMSRGLSTEGEKRYQFAYIPRDRLSGRARPRERCADSSASHPGFGTTHHRTGGVRIPNPADCTDTQSPRKQVDSNDLDEDIPQ